MGRLFVALIVLGISAGVTLGAQSDLDALMQKVLARRDGNWKKLQDYVLNEREVLQVTGPGSQPWYGFRREYLWYPQDGRFIRSPLTADGVAVGEAARREAEARWIEREARRGTLDGGDPLEPGFVSAAYFLNFRFEPGRYALVGRETLAVRHADGRPDAASIDVLRIEYYPAQMFKEGRTRPNRRLRERDDLADEKMNRTSLVTLWIDPGAFQIVQYEFENIDMDFLPAQPVLRLEGATARMKMGQPFPDVWLPATLEISFDMTLATGDVQGQYRSEYYDYRLAEITTRVR